MAEDIKDVSTRGALVAIAIATIVIAVVASMSILGPQVGSKAPDRKLYQAVTLTNGTLYFGKLRNISGQFVKIEDAYTIQAGQSTSSPGPQLSLVRTASNNLIKPENGDITVSRDSVVSWQNMSNDSEVVKKINESGDK